MLRDIITINEEKCIGCGNCVPGCPEGALQVIDGKARLVSALMCDGLGACIGDCPTGALLVEKREAEPYDEKKVMINIIRDGDNTIKAHLTHLETHCETDYYAQALEVLKENNLDPDDYIEGANTMSIHSNVGGCSGAKMIDLRNNKVEKDHVVFSNVSSQLQQWPIQMHLIQPNASYYQKADVVIAADCVAYAVGDFHNKYMKGNSIAIACPKLDQGIESYTEKVRLMIDEARVSTIIVMTMEVPCCNGLLCIVEEASSKARHKVPKKAITVSLEGKILQEDWI